MKICDNGVYRDMTTEEEKEWREDMENQTLPDPTPEQRIADLQTEITALCKAIYGGI